jgi:uncharacterized membrane protein
MNALERRGISPEQAWVGGLVAGVAAIVGAAVAFTEQIYYGFIWRYFWGPVHADAIGASCMVYDRATGTIATDPATGCARVAGNFVAEPGYTLVSEAGYMVVLVFMLVGVYLLVQRLDLEPYRRFFFALVPFMFFGGALRVVEDAFDRGIEQGVGAAVQYPLNTLFISPLIYFTVFGIALAAVFAGKYLAHRGFADSYHTPLAAIGTGVLALTVGYITVLSATTDYVEFYPLVFVVVMGLASLIAVGAYAAIERFAPDINAGTKYMGLVVLWAHAIDGVANVVASDWATAFGLPFLYGSKHPIDRILSDVVVALPGGIENVLGDSWLFLVVKVLVPVAILAVFEREFVEDSPRYSVMLLIAIVAVGMGPGTRDMIRVTFGI